MSPRIVSRFGSVWVLMSLVMQVVLVEPHWRWKTKTSLAPIISVTSETLLFCCRKLRAKESCVPVYLTWSGKNALYLRHPLSVPVAERKPPVASPGQVAFSSLRPRFGATTSGQPPTLLALVGERFGLNPNGTESPSASIVLVAAPAGVAQTPAIAPMLTMT